MVKLFLKMFFFCFACEHSIQSDLPLYTQTPQDGQYQIRLITFFAVEDGEALYSQQKQDLELTMDQIISS